MKSQVSDGDVGKTCEEPESNGNPSAQISTRITTNITNIAMHISRST